MIIATVGIDGELVGKNKVDLTFPKVEVTHRDGNQKVTKQFHDVTEYFGHVEEIKVLGATLHYE